MKKRKANFVTKTLACLMSMTAGLMSIGTLHTQAMEPELEETVHIGETVSDSAAVEVPLRIYVVEETDGDWRAPEHQTTGVELYVLDGNGDTVVQWTSDGTQLEVTAYFAECYTIHAESVPEGYVVPEDLTLVITGESGAEARIVIPKLAETTVAYTSGTVQTTTSEVFTHTTPFVTADTNTATNTTMPTTADTTATTNTTMHTVETNTATNTTAPDETTAGAESTTAAISENIPSTGVSDDGETGDTMVLYGDVDLDGRVDICDAVLLYKACSNAVTLNETARTNGDCNQNQELNVDDSLLLLKFLVHLEPSLPVHG